MYSFIQIPVTCLLILLYTLLFFNTKKRLHTMTSRMFGIMMIFSILHLISAAMAEYAISDGSVIESSLTVNIWYLVFLISITCICFVLTAYFILYIERKSGQIIQLPKYALIVMTIASIVAEIFLPMKYTNDSPLGPYFSGPKLLALYLVIIYTVLILIVIGIRYNGIIEKNKQIVLIASVIIFIITLSVQLRFPHILLTPTAVTMIMHGLMVSAEDSHTYISYGTGLYNEYGCRETLHELLIMQPRFKVGAYVFLSGSRDVQKAMMSVKDKLSGKQSRVICGTLADNVLLVLPMCGLTKNVHFPEVLPKAECPGANLNYTSEIFEFSREKTVSEIIEAIRNYKSKYEENSLQRDDLTGLLRRAAFMRQVNDMAKKGKGFTFLMIDVDDFKYVNDMYGHTVGDNVLRQVANVLISALTPSDAICRIGGDEYAAVLFGVSDTKIINNIIERIQKYLMISNGIPDDKHDITLSFGAKICSSEEEYTSFDDIYKAADDAVYKSKHAGKNQLNIAP